MHRPALSNFELLAMYYKSNSRIGTEEYKCFCSFAKYMWFLLSCQQYMLPYHFTHGIFCQTLVLFPIWYGRKKSSVTFHLHFPYYEQSSTTFHIFNNHLYLMWIMWSFLLSIYHQLVYFLFLLRELDIIFLLDIYCTSGKFFPFILLSFYLFSM